MQKIAEVAAVVAAAAAAALGGTTWRSVPESDESVLQ